MVRVDTGISTAKATEWTRQHWAQHFSTMGWAAVRASRSSAPTTQGGATLAAPPSWSQPPTFALQTLLNPATMAAGATLPGPTSTSPCPCFSRLPSTAPESSPSLTAGELTNLCFFFLFVLRLALVLFILDLLKCPYYISLTHNNDSVCF